MNAKRMTLLLTTLLMLLLWGSTAVAPVHAATITVTNLDDSGPGSLRQAIADAAPGDTINFDVSGTIELASTLTINKSLTINGNGQITLNGNNTFRIVVIPASHTVTLRGLTITNGRAASGGGIHNSGTLHLVNSTLSNNSTSGGSANYGGGLYNANGSVTISNSTFAGNTISGSGWSWGGGLYNANGSVTISNSTFAGNIISAGSHSYGGGLYNANGSVTISNSTFAGNTASGGTWNYGGGIYNPGGSVTISNSTFSGNTVSGGTWNYGGAIYTNSAIVTINHTILSNNTGSRGPNCSGTLTSQGYNLISDTADCTISGDPTGNITGQSANLGPLQNNGGLTLSRKPNNGSPAIGAGGANCGTTFDQRGAARPYNSNCDIGAVEVRETITTSSCGGADLSGPQQFNFASGTVTIVVNSSNGLNCIEVEEMGANHLLATGSPGNSGIHTGNWWHISGNINSGFDVAITLPYGSANGASRVCQWPGNLGGAGWDCDDGSDTSFVAGTSVTRAEISSFSDWAVGDEVGPTAVTLQSLTAVSQQGGLAALAATLLTALSGIWLWARRLGKAEREM